MGKEIVTATVDSSKLKGQLVCEVVQYLRDLADEIESEYGESASK